MPVFPDILRWRLLGVAILAGVLTPSLVLAEPSDAKAIARAAEFDDETHLRRWFCRTGRNAAIDAVRRSARQACLLPDAAIAALAADEETTVGPGWRDRLISLRDCLGTLTPRAREVVELRYGHDLSGEAVARRLDRQTDSVYRSLSRSYQHLRECIRRREAMGGADRG